MKKKITFIAFILLITVTLLTSSAWAYDVQLGQKYFGSEDWEEIYPITKASNVIMDNGFDLETYLTNYLNHPNDDSQQSVSEYVYGSYNVKNYGAKGDGITNDTAAIQNALDAAEALGGGEVYFPSGRYYISQVTVGDNILLKGAGSSAVLYCPSGNAIVNKNVNNLTGNSDIHIQDLTIDLNGTGNNGIILSGVTRGSVKNVKIMSPKGYGIWLFRAGDSSAGEGRPTKHVIISNCHVTGVVDVGIEFSGCIGCVAIGNTVTGTAGIAGFYAWNGATDCVFIGNVSEGEGTASDYKAYAVQGADIITNPVPVQTKTQTQRISFIGNIARNARFGLRIQGSAQSEILDIVAQGNVFYGRGNEDAGVSIAYAQRVAIKDNQLINFCYPLLLSNIGAGNAWNSAKYIDFEGNSIYGGYGCLLYGNVGGSFTNNKVYNQISHAVRLYGWKNCNASNNTFVNLGYNTAASAIVLYSCGSECTGNNLIGNKAMDDRPIKYTDHVVLLTGNADYNIAVGNNAYGARSGARGAHNVGSGSNNVIANNIDAQ